MPLSVTPIMIGDCADVLEIEPKKFGDERGFFSEVYSRPALRDAGIEIDFIQDNHSLSAEVGTVRGLHFQLPPYAQTKLLRVTSGEILDVMVDIRKSSPTFGRHATVIISSERWNQVLIPAGFAHGFCTTKPNTEVIYKVDAPYAPEYDRGILWNDPALGINWPVEHEKAILSDKDIRHPPLAKAPDVFEHDS